VLVKSPSMIESRSESGAGGAARLQSAAAAMRIPTAATEAAGSDAQLDAQDAGSGGELAAAGLAHALRWAFIMRNPALPLSLALAVLSVALLGGCRRHTLVDPGSLPTQVHLSGGSIPARTFGGERVELRGRRVEVVTRGPSTRRAARLGLRAPHVAGGTRPAGTRGRGQQFFLGLGTSLDLVRTDDLATGGLVAAILMVVAGAAIGLGFAVDGLRGLSGFGSMRDGWGP